MNFLLTAKECSKFHSYGYIKFNKLGKKIASHTKETLL